MIQDRYLKAADESALYIALQLAGLATIDSESGAWITHPNLDNIGPIQVDTGTTMIDADGNEQPVMASQPGFFANIYKMELTDEQIAALPITAEPKTKYRVLASG